MTDKVTVSRGTNYKSEDFDRETRWRVGTEERIKNGSDVRYRYTINNDLPNDKYAYPDFYMEIPFPDSGDTEADKDILALHRLIAQEICGYLNWYPVLIEVSSNICSATQQVVKDMSNLDPKHAKILGEAALRLFGALECMTIEISEGLVEVEGDE